MINCQKWCTNTKFILIKAKYYHQRLSHQLDFSSKQKIKAENIIFGNMPAKPNVCVVWQCRQINFKGEGTKYFKKGPLLLSLLFCNYYYSIIIVVATENGDEISKNLGLRKKSFQIRHLCFHLSTPFRVLPTLRMYWNV